MTKAEGDDAAPLLAVMSHKLRTPLNGLLGLSRLIRERNDAPELAGYLEILEQSVRQLAAMTSDVIDFSTASCGKLSAHPVPTDVSDLMQVVARSAAADAFGKHLDFRLEIAKDVPERVVIDAARLHQIVNHLLNNAVRYTDRGSVELSVSFRDSTQHGPELTFVVTDTGAGMNIAQDAHLPTGAVLGNGLRLTSTLVELLQGRLLFSSIVGKGTVVTAHFPIELVPGESHDTAVMGCVEGVALIVTDNVSLGDCLGRNWVQVGGETVLVRPLREVLVRGVQKESYGTVFFDCGTSVPKALEELHVLEEVVGRQIVPILPSSNLSLLGEFTNGGFDQILVRPFTARELARVVSTVRADESQSSRPDRLRILVVDDVRINQVVLVKHLEQAGHDVTATSSGREAIEYLERHGHFSPSEKGAERRFDIVIMDIDMPLLNGLQATEQIRNLERLHRSHGGLGHVPIIAATADLVTYGEEDFLAAGMEWYLSKPIDHSRLLQLVEHFGRLSSAGNATVESSEDAIDVAWLREQFSYEEDIIREVMEAFLDEVDSLWLNLMRASMSVDGPQVRAAAHALKGSLQNVGARTAAYIASEIEALAKAGVLSDLQVDVDNLAEQVKVAKVCAQRLRS